MSIGEILLVAGIALVAVLAWRGTRGGIEARDRDHESFEAGPGGASD